MLVEYDKLAAADIAFQVDVERGGFGLSRTFDEESLKPQEQQTMPHLLIRHSVQDFASWKAGYDDHKPARDAAGLTELYLLQGAADPNDVVLLFEADDLEKVRRFATSEDLKETMTRVGVVGTPTVVELR